MPEQVYRTAHLINAWRSAAQSRGEVFRLPDCLADLRELGYHGVFADAADLMDFRPEDLRRLLADFQLQLASLVLPVTANEYPPNEAIYRAGLELAAAMDLKIVCVCGGFLPSKRRVAFESDYAEFGANYLKAASFAEELGIRLAFHPHRNCLVETGSEIARMEQHVPELNMHLDVGHILGVGEDPLEIAEPRKERLLQVAFKDWNPSSETFAGFGTGEQSVDLARLATVLSQSPGYDGWLYVEHDGCTGSAKTSARTALHTLKQYFPIAVDTQ